MARTIMNSATLFLLLTLNNIATAFFEHDDINAILTGSSISADLAREEDDICLMDTPRLYLHSTTLAIFQEPRTTLVTEIDKLLKKIDQICPFPLERLVIYFDFHQHSLKCLTTRMIYTRKQNNWHLKHTEQSGSCKLEKMIAEEQKYKKPIIEIWAQRKREMESGLANSPGPGGANRTNTSTGLSRREQAAYQQAAEAAERAEAEIKQICMNMANRMGSFGITCGTKPRY